MNKMKTFKVALTRTYLISIEAKTASDAKLYTEYYLGNCQDLSNRKEQIEKHFSIEEIEMVYNEADEIILEMN